MSQKQLHLLLTPLVALLLGSPGVRAQEIMYSGGGEVAVPSSCGPGGCSTGGCGSTGWFSGLTGWGCHCPKYSFCSPLPPKICWKCVCAPKQVCEPCDIQGDGYYPTCWRPYMQTVSYCHCPVAPPTVVLPHVAPPPTTLGPALSPGETDEVLPTPRTK